MPGVLGLLGAVGCGVHPNAADSRISTVVLVSLDTWRHDAAGFLGNHESSPTPFLDQMASDALVLTDAVAPVPITAPSHWSMLSGRWPWRDGVRVNGDRPESNHEPTLAQVLAAHRWRTAAFVSVAVLDHRFGFAAGFQHYDDQVSRDGNAPGLESAERRGDHTVGTVLGWLEDVAEDDRLFLWVHLYDPHQPHQPPTGPHPGKHPLYLGEVAFADQQVAALATGLEALGRSRERTLWIVLSDHGEGLGEHDENAHGFILHGATTRIPFLISGPGVTPGRRADLVSTVDVFPTVLDALDVAVERRDGRSLLEPPPNEARSIPLETLGGLRAFGLSEVFGLRTAEWLWERSPADHLWNVVSDPAETENRAAAHPDQCRLFAEQRSVVGQPAPQPPDAIDPALAASLRALGYATSSTISGEGDVREFLGTGGRWYYEITSRHSRGDLEGAETFATRFLERYPKSPEVWLEAGLIAAQLGTMEAAEQRFRRATALDPSNAAARLNLANALYVTDQKGAAESEYRVVLDLDDEDLFALYNLGMLLAAQNRYHEAADPWRKFLRLYPNHPRAAEVMTALSAWKASGRL